MAQVIGLRKNGVIQRLPERLPHSYVVAAAARLVRKSGIALRSAMYLQALSEGSRICMQRHLTFGGVSPRGTLLREQSIIEYVLIIAIIGLVIVFAGPGVAGAIRNQFNLVGNTVNSGTTGGVEGGGASGGGSAGVDSSTVQAAVAKDAKDWTLDEQEAVAKDIAAKGEASPAYAKAEAAMKAETEWSVKLTNGRTMTYRIIGINHDDLADGTGKAGLTFWAVSNAMGEPNMNSAMSNAGGWEKSRLRQKMNSGEVWNLLPPDFQAKVETVKKLTNNIGCDKNAAVTATFDKLFLLSNSEIVETPWNGWSDYAWLSKEGTQYEAFTGCVKNNHSDNFFFQVLSSDNWFERSISPTSSQCFLAVDGYYGNPSTPYNATNSSPLYPGFCF